ncbi:MAG: orange carotenoid protein N-terminal domain-containing protein [Elainellaceae cyanobacterium]
MAAALDKIMAFLDEKQKDLVKTFLSFGTDETLAALYFIYKKMGDTITTAAPGAADPELAPQLLGDFYALSNDDQLAVMREIANKAETQYSRAYGALTENNQLVVWYAWAKSMGDTVVDMPGDYKPTDAMNTFIGDLEAVDFESQISILRAAVTDMGCSAADAVVTQENTTKTANVTNL